MNCTIDMWTFEFRSLNAAEQLHKLGQSLWLDDFTRDLLNQGTLQKHIDDLAVTGLTSDPTILDQAIRNGSAYDLAIRQKLDGGMSSEEIFFDLAIEDLTRAADLLRPTFNQTNGVDGWVSLEISPSHAYDVDTILEASKELYARADRSNLFIKIPGTKQGLAAIEEVIYAGVPVNVTLLFSREQYMAAADAYLRGIERRIEDDLNPDVASVASVFINCLDAAVAGKVPYELENKLGITIASRIYSAYCSLLASPRWKRTFNAGARPQRLLWASTGTKNTKESDVLYIKTLAAPFTVHTVPEAALKAFADHGKLGSTMAADDDNCEGVVEKFAKSGVSIDLLASQLQKKTMKSFVKSWNDLMALIISKSSELKQAV